ncbi:hypothetical protein [Sphingomonas sp. Leaf4]|uniref:hypothetical protein n=1 Tax=Sphingomonas sp. Leaf4 TaxID=2876553 RepID=UPI001E4D0CB4|nr:hypothetical protein [Sphingomonas sp. Leaf4]
MAGLMLLAASAASAPRLAGGGALDISLTRIVAALVLCLMAAALAAILLKRGGGRIDLSRLGMLRRTVRERRIAVIESRRISPHADLCLLRCDGNEYLILSSATGQQIVRARPVGEGAA